MIDEIPEDLSNQFEILAYLESIPFEELSMPLQKIRSSLATARNEFKEFKKQNNFIS